MYKGGFLEGGGRRKIRLIEKNAKFTCKGTLRQVIICLRPPPLLGFVWGGKAILCVLNLVRYILLNSSEYGLNTTQHPANPSEPHTVCVIYTLYFDFGRGGGEGEVNLR